MRVLPENDPRPPRPHPAAVPWAASFLAAALLAGCASTASDDPDSRYYQIPAGTQVIVRQAIDIAAGSAHATLQRGQRIAPEALRRYEPFCEIEVNDVRDAAQQVRPGRFAVTRIVRQQQQHGALAVPTRLAAREGIAGLGTLAGFDIGIGVGVGSGGRFGFGIGVGTAIGERDGDLVLNAVHFRLQSGEQPNVRELRCSAGWAPSGDAVYPTLAEMRGALGTLIELAIPPSP